MAAVGGRAPAEPACAAARTCKRATVCWLRGPFANALATIRVPRTPGLERRRHVAQCPVKQQRQQYSQSYQYWSCVAGLRVLLWDANGLNSNRPSTACSLPARAHVANKQEIATRYCCLRSSVVSPTDGSCSDCLIDDSKSLSRSYSGFGAGATLPLHAQQPLYFLKVSRVRVAVQSRADHPGGDVCTSWSTGSWPGQNPQACASGRHPQGLDRARHHMGIRVARRSQPQQHAHVDTELAQSHDEVHMCPASSIASLRACPRS